MRIAAILHQDSSSFFPLKYAVGLHGYVLVYDTTNRTSFDLIQVIHEKMLEAMGAEWMPCVVVGNKSDIENSRCATLFTSSFLLP